MSYSSGFNILSGVHHAMRHDFDGNAQEITGLGGKPFEVTNTPTVSHNNTFDNTM